jgi:hypothetical protein
VFRNGQLLNNDQYNLTDTNKITIVSTSFKIGANYTVATVSGIGSVGSAQAGNPVYPEAGIALSTGTTWASSITNNSSNWNTAFTDRLKWDGGSTGLVASTGRTSLGGTTVGQSMFTLTNPSAITFPQFNADNSVSALSAASFRSAIGGGTVTSVTVSGTSGNPLSILNTTTTPVIELLSATSARNGYLTSTDWTTFNNKQAALGFTPANSTITIATTAPLQGGGNLTTDRTLSILSASETQSGIVNTSSQLFGGSKVFKNRVTIDSVFTLNTTSSIPTQILGINTTGNVNSVGKFTLGSGLNITLGGILQADTTFLFTQSDTLSLNLTSRFAAKLNLSDTLSMLSKYLRRADTTSMLLPYLRRADTTLMLTPYLRKADTTSMLLPYFRDADTTALNLTLRFAAKLNYTDTSFLFTQSDTNQLNLTNRFATKQNTLNGTGFVKASGTNITYDNSSYLRTGLADSTYLKLTGGTLTGNLVVNGTTRLIGNVAINTTTAYKPLEVWSNANDFVSVGVKDLNYGEYSGIHFGYVESNSQYRKSAIVFQRTDYGIGDASGKIHFLNVPSFLAGTNASLSYARMTINSNGNVGVNDTLPSSTLSVNGTLGVTGAATLSSTLAVTGDITENGNNVLTNLDTVSLSNRINGKVGLTGNESISGTKTFNSLVNLSSNLILIGSYSSTNKLLGKNSSDGVGNITVGSGLNLTSDVLNVNSKITNIDTSQYSITSTDVYIDNKNSSSTTIILPLAGLNVFRELKFKNSSTGALIANGNIIPLSGSGTTTTILPATNAKWCTLVSDGTDWIIMQAN